jgi:hypothetical protein
MFFFFCYLLVLSLLTVIQFVDESPSFPPKAPTNVRVAVHGLELYVVASWLPYSSSSGKAVHDLSGLKRSIFINSLKLSNPKSFS